ncbi:MAG: amino acid adenylation domain-containing protein [Daejeonella sp.]
MNEQEYKLQSIEFDPFAGPEIEKVVPVTEPQAEIWSSYVIGGEDANRSYNESVSLHLKGLLDCGAMEASLRDLVNRHEVLRSGFSADGKHMCIFKDTIPEYIQEDISHLNQEQQKEIIDNFLLQDANTSFNILTGSLFRVNLFKIDNENNHLTLSAHHIICDGWSVGIIMQDLSHLYSAYARGKTSELPEAPSFADYALRQKLFQTTKEYKSIENYWLNQYSGDIPVLDIPSDHLRPEIKTYSSHRDDYKLSPNLVRELKKMGSQAGCSFVTTMLVAFEVFLHKISGQDDIILGVPSAGQSVEGNYGLVGHCVNMLPVRSHHNDESRFTDFLKERKPAIFDAYENQHFTFGSLLQKISVSRDASRVPLIPVVFNIDIGLDDGVMFEGLSHALTINKREFENFEIFLNASGSGENLTLEWSYNTQLFKSDTISRMMADFESLLWAIAEFPEIKIGEIPMKASEELLLNLNKWNNTDTDYPSDIPVHKLIEQKVSEYPEKIAFRFRDDAYTYKDLNEHSNRLSALLLANSITAGDCVALATERSPAMIISLLAILKTGAAYVPVDPSYPTKRIEFMLADSSAKLVITTSNHRNKFSPSVKQILMDEEMGSLKNYSPENPITNVRGKDLAYIIYTSGSSGQPKGIQIGHCCVVNFLNSMRKAPGINADDRLLAVTTISFDIAGLELLLPLVNGAQLILADDEAVKDGRILADLIKSERISIMQATPSTWKMMIDSGWNTALNLKILCGGEALSRDLANKLLRLGREVWNMYGPTETTIWSAIKQVKSGDEAITLGHPIDNTRFYILNRDLKPVMPGLAGEIYIAGAGLSRGYLNQPELTAANFIYDPFSLDKPGKMYRTGDLGKFSREGEIIYLGRIDDQVKIRGHRIELNAIEHCLNTQTGIKEAVVIVREDIPGDQRLVAYIIPESSLDDKESPSWQERWEDLYKRGIQSESNLDINEQQLDIAVAQQISGRNDIREEVEEWLAQSVTRIRALNAKKIMELGCGAGQLLFELAPLAESFVATDYAQTAIDKLKEKLAADPGKWKNVQAFTTAADDFSNVEKASLDLVIINGVVQYFPDSHYLVKVIEEASKAVRNGGCIYIGDMQGKSTLPMYHASDQVNRSDDEQLVSGFKQIISRRVMLEDELVADPGFFYLLPAIIPAITSVNIQLREGKHINETTKYHYDIWLYVNSELNIADAEINIGWDADKTIEWISAELGKYPGKVVTVKNIYNSRTASDHFLQGILKNAGENEPIKNIKQQAKNNNSGIDPHLFWELGKKLGCSSHVRYTRDGSDGLFDVVFIPGSLDKAIPDSPDFEDPEAESLHDYARDPFSGNITVSGQQSVAWKQGLNKILPVYMIPSEFVILKKIPLLPNGKTDRKALPIPVRIITEWENNALPGTDAEKIVARIWEETLSLESVNLKDDFFKLGGHSLIAIQVMIRMEKETGLRLPLTSLFKHSSVEEFALLFTK